jgi:FkbM family methyltransferase
MALLLLRLSKLATVCGSPSLAKAFFFHRVLAAVEHRAALSRPLNTVIDIGANRGQFSLAARAAAPKSNIVAFEPLEAPANTFRTVFQSDSGTRLVQAAIGESSALQLMHVSARDDSSSLLEITALQEEIFPGTKEASITTVKVGPLAEFVDRNEIKSPALLKLDVQGFELQALEGCRSLITSFDYVYCECSFVELYSGQALAPKVVQWLSERGFPLCGVFNTSFDGRGQPIQADFLFSRNGAKFA